MFLDIYTFSVSRSEIQEKRRLSRRHPVLDLNYSVKLFSWTEQQYGVELEGKYGRLRFKKISLEGKYDRTTLVMVAQTANRTLFLALTPLLQQPNVILASQTNVRSPVPIFQPVPVFPSAIKKTRMTGKVLIQCIINAEGKVMSENLLLLECPHYLFARNSLDVLLNSWRFLPGTRDGTPVSVRADVEITFSRR
jgi:hypothetical protein